MRTEEEINAELKKLYKGREWRQKGDKTIPQLIEVLGRRKEP